MIGISAGSMFSLDFGVQLKRDIVIGNDKLRKDQREFVGEYCLFAQIKNPAARPQGMNAAGITEMNTSGFQTFPLSACGKITGYTS